MSLLENLEVEGSDWTSPTQPRTNPAILRGLDNKDSFHFGRPNNYGSLSGLSYTRLYAVSDTDEIGKVLAEIHQI